MRSNVSGRIVFFGRISNRRIAENSFSPMPVARSTGNLFRTFRRVIAVKKSCWINTASALRFGKITKNLQVNVVVVGAGITGITAAHEEGDGGRIDLV